MKVMVYKTAEEIAEAVGRIIIKRVADKPSCAIGFATGASPVPTYEYIVSEYDKGNISFKDMKTFNLDEYCDLPVDDKNSYHTFMHENLFDKIDVKPENINFLDGNAEDCDAESARYAEAIKAAGGIKVQILGIGTNGHIGFNEPADEFTDEAFKVTLTQSTIDSNQKYFGEQAMPRYAMTMGIGSIMRSEEIVLIATGEAKAKAIAAAVNGEVTPQCPASILQTHKNVTFFVDEAAASLLK